MKCTVSLLKEALTAVTSNTLAQKARISVIKKLFQEKEEKQ